jgi:general secretion pathway protein L
MDVDFQKSAKVFFAWWGRELAAMLPGPIRAGVLGRGPRLDATVEDDRLILQLVDGHRARRTEIDRTEGPPDRPTRRAIATLLAEAEEIVLRLPQRQVLRPIFDLPLSAGGALDEALVAEIGRRTPFRLGDIRWDWRVRSSDMELERLYVELLIARRSDVSDALAAAGAAGIQPARLAGPAQGDTEEPAFDLMPTEARRRRRPTGVRLVKPLALAVVVLAVAWGVLALERREAELHALEARLEALRTENAAVTTMENRYDELAAMRSSLAEQKQNAVPVIEILADITRRLPDGDWVYGYTAEDGKLSLQGVSQDASRLPNLLEESAYLSAVAFSAPVRHDAQLERDDFVITAVLGGAG